jgi:predicted secreted protein
MTTWIHISLLSLLALAGCQRVQTGDIMVVVGRQHDISLPYTAGTGYSWSVDDANSVGLDHVEVVKSGDTPQTASLPGGPGSSQWSIAGRSVGQAEIQFVYRRPWETSTPPAKVRRVRVEIK